MRLVGGDRRRHGVVQAPSRYVDLATPPRQLPPAQASPMPAAALRVAAVPNAVVTNPTSPNYTAPNIAAPNIANPNVATHSNTVPNNTVPNSVAPSSAPKTQVAVPAAPAGDLRPVGTGGVRPETGTPNEGLKSLDVTPRKSIARVTPGTGALPNGQRQVWREYDLTPFTQRNPEILRPESVVVDWILRETGYEAWHGDVLSILSAMRRRCACITRPRCNRWSTRSSIGSSIRTRPATRTACG
ncbi:MAG: hypothetical protein QM811_31120 [Pirellulales bacterium]